MHYTSSVQIIENDSSKYVSDPVHAAIHQRAVMASADFRRSESSLMSALEDVEKNKVHLILGYTSLFQYAVRELNLSENVAYTMITVIRKAKEVPELKTQLSEGKIHLGHAKRIAAVITPENSTEWFDKASSLTQRQLEKEVVKVRPLSAVQERASYVAENRIKLEVGLSESQMLRLRKAQDLVCQSTAKHASIEDTLVALTEFYLKHRDPVAKATRITVKKGSVDQSKTAPLNAPAQVGQSKTPDVQSAAQVEQSNMPVVQPSVQADQSKLSAVQPQPQVDQSMTLVSKQTGTSLKTSSNHRAGFIQRQPIPAAILHAVNLRDQRKCTYINPLGRPCGQTRWVEVHHVIPVSHGGQNTLDNLVTLCSGHHKIVHSKKLNRRV
jgi:hypothetical protein